MTPLAAVLIGIACAGFGALAVFLFGLIQSRGRLRRKGEIIAQAEEEAERVKKEASLAAKEESLRRREALESEVSTGRAELRELEKRVSKREDNL